MSDARTEGGSVKLMKDRNRGSSVLSNRAGLMLPLLLILTGCLLPMSEIDYDLRKEGRIIDFDYLRDVSFGPDGTVYLSGSARSWGNARSLCRWSEGGGLERLHVFETDITNIAACRTGVFVALGEQLVLWHLDGTLETVEVFADKIQEMFALTDYILVIAKIDRNIHDFYLFPQSGETYTDSVRRVDPARGGAYAPAQGRIYLVEDDGLYYTDDHLWYLEIDESSGSIVRAVGSGYLADPPLVLSLDEQFLVDGDGEVFEVSGTISKVYTGGVRVPGAFGPGYAAAGSWDWDESADILFVRSMGCYPGFCGQVEWVELAILHGDVEAMIHLNNALHIVTRDDFEEKIYIYEIDDSIILEAL